jgi:surfactin family lipopeptide synthetase C
VVVASHAQSADERHLVAYLVPTGEDRPEAGVLRHYLKTRLPEYMLPSAIVWLAAFPRTPNGKLDRAALPLPGSARPDLEQALISPRTPIEVVVAGIWADILGLERIGVSDNFFDLGGHSLSATQVVNRIRDVFRAELPLRSIFDSPTVAGLADALVANESRPGRTDRIAQMIKEVQKMSADEVGELLQQAKGAGSDHA